MLAAPVLRWIADAGAAEHERPDGGARGHIDTLKLARELGAPVAQISAVHGTGLEAVPLFLNQQTERKAAKPLALPVLGNAASTHSWAAQVSRRTGYQAPLSAETRARSTMYCCTASGTAAVPDCGGRRLEVVFSIGQPMSDGFGDILARMGELVRPFLPAAGCSRWCWMEPGRASLRCWCFCRRSCCCSIHWDSGGLGYLARAALIADRVMRTSG